MRTLNKLDGLNVLTSAYDKLKKISPLSKHGAGPGDSEALALLSEKFHQIRRSIQNIEEVLPVPEFNEGFNGRMPRYL